MLEIMDRISAEIQEALPNVSLLIELNNEMLPIQTARMTKAAEDIAQLGKTDEFGIDPNKQTADPIKTHLDRNMGSWGVKPKGLSQR